MDQANIVLGILQETKTTNRVYVRESAGSCVVTLYALIRHHRGVSLFYRESLRLEVEAHHQHGPHIASFELVTGGRR